MEILATSFATLLTAVCTVQNVEKENHFSEYRYAKVYLSDETSEFYNFTKLEEATAFEAPTDRDIREIYTGKLEEEMGRSRTYARPILEHARKTYGSATVMKVRNAVIKKQSELSAGSVFGLEVEHRDYDSDYSGLFYWLNGYVVKAKGQFNCTVL